MSRFPNHPGKRRARALFDPADFLAYRRSLEPDTPEGPNAPDAMIVVFQRRLLDGITRRLGPGAAGDLRGVLRVSDETPRMGAMRFPIGAPAAVIAFEEAVARGVRRFVTIGTAGSLQRSLPVGSLVVCDRAIRDEGTSHHYLEPAKYVDASAGLTRELVRALERRGHAHLVGSTWTTDAPYRETHAEVRAYGREGVAVVDMEAAALFAVGAYRGVEVAALFCVSDSLTDGSWAPAFESTAVVDGLVRLFEAAREGLTSD